MSTQQGLFGLLVPGMYSEKGSSWLSHCGGHQRRMQQEVPLLGSPSPGDLTVWGNSGDASLGSVPTTVAARAPDTGVGSPSGASSEATSLTLRLANGMSHLSWELQLGSHCFGVLPSTMGRPQRSSLLCLADRWRDCSSVRRY